MTMVPAENPSKQQQLHLRHHHHHQYLVYSNNNNNNNNKDAVYPGGCGDDNYSEYLGGLMSRIEIQGHDYYCTSTQTTDQSNCFLGSDLVLVGPPMAEDESRTNSLNESSSKDERDEGWLQLGIGTGHMESNNKNNLQTATATTTTTTTDQRRSSGGLVELDLLPGAGGGGLPSSRQLAIRSSSAPMFHVPEIAPHPHPPPRPFSNFTTTSLYFQQHHHHRHHMASSSSNFPSHHQQEVNWAFRPILSHNIGTASTSSSSVSSSSSSMPPLGAGGGSSSYFPRQFQLQQSGLMDVSAAGPSIDFRVVSPPRRPHSGIWFMLQASQNQAKQPFLPQIPKNYLRIKDGGMTVRLLIKYLVNKLRLDSESEIEITCRGQQLLPFLTLQHVRDHIWSRRDAVSLLPDSPNSTSTSDHVMVLQYARTSA